MVWGVVPGVEIAAETFSLEAELLVEENCRVVNCDMKGDVLPHTCLYEVVQHERPNATPPPIWVHQEERDVGFVHTHIWDEESTAHGKLPKQRHYSEVRILEAFCHICTSPEKVCYKGIHGGVPMVSTIERFHCINNMTIWCRGLLQLLNCLNPPLGSGALTQCV